MNKLTRKGNTAAIWGYPRAVFVTWVAVNVALVIVAAAAVAGLW